MHNESTTIDQKQFKLENLLDDLCALLDDELERQENIHQVALSQKEAALARDSASLEARTRAMQLLVLETLEVEKQRINLVTDVVKILEIPSTMQSLTGLIELAPQPWSRRLAYFQKRFNEVILETRSIIRDNNKFISLNLRQIDQVLNVLTKQNNTEQAYSATGTVNYKHKSNPFLMDQRG